MDQPLRVRAPATSANLGPAFDAAGVALDWWDELEVRPAPADGTQLSGEQAELLPTGPDNLVRVAMRRLAEAAGVPLPPLHLTLVKGFPLGRGFGSSAAAVVLGLVAARRLVAPDLPEAELLALACELEGHPDNATPCLHGGATLAWVEDGRPRWRPLPLHPDLVALALVAGEHLFLYGPPGTAKSALIRQFAAAVQGRYFEYMLTRFSEPNEIFGPI
ncbi:MAG TPA: AAA family ATPase, partial [Actinomycetes bacterium]|nr:AAA family ATPase [Actinomycetes bacterium]